MAFVRLGETFRELRSYRNAFLMLLAFLIYNDGIQTIIKMATAYGTEIGIGQNALIGAILLVQFVGIPCSFLFGMLAGRIGAKRALFLGLLAYTGISVLGYFMKTAFHFYVLAGLVGTVQGGTQALSRSLFASMIPQHKSGEFFGFFSIFEKFAGIFGPLIFAGTIAATGSSRNAILSVILLLCGRERSCSGRSTWRRDSGLPGRGPGGRTSRLVSRHALKRCRWIYPGFGARATTRMPRSGSSPLRWPKSRRRPPPGRRLAPVRDGCHRVVAAPPRDGDTRDGVPNSSRMVALQLQPPGPRLIVALRGTTVRPPAVEGSLGGAV